jgi:hypothetical protein
MLGGKQEPWGMSYRVAGEHGGAPMATSVEGARTALIIARDWERRGVRRITITNENGDAYDLDAFDKMATKQEPTDADRT